MYIKIMHNEVFARLVNTNECQNGRWLDIWNETGDTHHTYHLRILRLKIMASMPIIEGSVTHEYGIGEERTAQDYQRIGSASALYRESESNATSDNGTANGRSQDGRTTIGIREGNTVERDRRQSNPIRSIRSGGVESRSNTSGLREPAKVYCIAHAARQARNLGDVSAFAQTGS